jgi:phosphoglycerate-specific signal transduction histidine kinase
MPERHDVDIIIVDLPDRINRFERQMLERLDRLEHLFRTFTQEIHHMAGELDTLTAAVEEETTVNGSAIMLLNQLSDLIRANATDPTALRALADRVSANSASLAGAVTANTPAAA